MGPLVPSQRGCVANGHKFTSVGAAGKACLPTSPSPQKPVASVSTSTIFSPQTPAQQSAYKEWMSAIIARPLPLTMGDDAANQALKEQFALNDILLELRDQLIYAFEMDMIHNVRSPNPRAHIVALEMVHSTLLHTFGNITGTLNIIGCDSRKIDVSMAQLTANTMEMFAFAETALARIIPPIGPISGPPIGVASTPAPAICAAKVAPTSRSSPAPAAIVVQYRTAPPSAGPRTSATATDAHQQHPRTPSPTHLIWNSGPIGRELQAGNA